MNNYHYIVASLPVLTTDYRFTAATPDSIMSEIKEQLTEKDLKVVELLEEGFVPENLSREFYEKALAHKNAFVRDYFAFDLSVRNAKVAYLNSELGRPASKDILDMDVPEFEEADRLAKILESGDILGREKGMDELVWDKIESLTTFKYFDIDVILGFIAKLHIVARWFLLDEQTGREMFRKLVDEVRGTFKGVEYNEK